MDDNMIAEFDMTGYDTDTDWLCDLGDIHPRVFYDEVNGGPCPYWMLEGFPDEADYPALADVGEDGA